MKHRSLVIVLLFGLLLMVACGSSEAPSSSDAPDASTGSSDTSAAANTQSAGGNAERVKVSAEVGGAPLVLAEGTSDGPAARGATGPTSDVVGVCLSAAEGELARLVNEYRASLNLPPLQISKSLSLVAQQHAWDTVNNSNAWPAPPAGKSCNMHSWSSIVNPALQQGTWTGNCYTSDHANAQGMWNKPGEIAGFPGEGVENSFASSGTATASGALTAWKNSPGHNNVITQQGGWGPMASMGVGMLNGVAHLWLSWVTDPAGEALLCSGGSAMTPPTAVPPTAVPPTAVPTAVPPTAVPPTAAPTDPAATAAPTVAPTAVPPTAAPTNVPPTAAPTTAPTGGILNENGTIAAGETTEHTFNVAQGRTYTVVVTPSADFDVDPRFDCTLSGGGGASGGFDWNWEGEAETFTYAPPAGTGTCRITVGGYLGSVGTYTIAVTAR